MSDTNSLYNEFARLVELGDEAKVRQFVVDHFQEFPEDIQGKLTLAFFEEALSNEAETTGSVSSIKDAGASALQDMVKIKGELEDKLKVINIKEDLNK